MNDFKEGNPTNKEAVHSVEAQKENYNEDETVQINQGLIIPPVPGENSSNIAIHLINGHIFNPHVTPQFLFPYSRLVPLPVIDCVLYLTSTIFAILNILHCELHYNILYNI